MIKGEYQMYQRFVIRYFPNYPIYKLYNPKKCTLKKYFECLRGQNMMWEGVVQAALTIERWCAEHHKSAGNCDCPLRKWSYNCYLMRCNDLPHEWNLEEFLRTKGMKHD